MRFMMIVKADSNAEAGVLPTEQQLADMAKYNEELVKAGVLLAAVPTRWLPTETVERFSAARADLKRQVDALAAGSE